MCVRRKHVCICVCGGGECVCVRTRVEGRGECVTVRVCAYGFVWGVSSFKKTEGHELGIDSQKSHNDDSLW